MPTDLCMRCGYTLTPEDTLCPKCRLPVRRDQVTPPGGGPTAKPTAASPRDVHREREEVYRPESARRAEGQDWPGSWGYIKHIAKQDPLIGVVMGLQAVEAALSIPQGIFAMIIPVATFWGVFTFQLWGFWLAVILSGLNALWAVTLLVRHPVAALFAGAIPIFTLVVLAMRRDYFR